MKPCKWQIRSLEQFSLTLGNNNFGYKISQIFCQDKKKLPSGEDTTGGVISNCFGTLESTGSTIGSSSGSVVTTSESSSTQN